MKKEKLELAMQISESVIDNFNESTVTSDIAQFPNLMSKIMRKVYTKSLVGELGDIQPLTGPIGKVATVFSGYGGRENSGLRLETSAMISVTDSTGLQVDDVISTANATAQIEYIDGNNILIRNIAAVGSNSGKFFVNDTITDSTQTLTTVVTGVFTNRFYASHVLKDYTGDLLSMEYQPVYDLDFEVSMKTIEAVSHKMRAIVTQEVITDMQNMYGVDVAETLLAQEFANEMIQEIDSEIISYLRKIATPRSDLILRYSYGINNGDLSGIAMDLIANVYDAAQTIAANTRRKQNFFVLGDVTTISLMMTLPLHVQPQVETDNIYYKGKLGALYDLYVDPYATDNYCIVGYSNGYGGTGDAGLIYSPYMNQIIETKNPESGQPIFYNLVRYGYTTHPQDTGTGNSDSIFFTTFNIDFNGLQNFKYFGQPGQNPYTQSN
jgi:Major capsid protein Gp23